MARYRKQSAVETKMVFCVAECRLPLVELGLRCRRRPRRDLSRQPYALALRTASFDPIARRLGRNSPCHARTPIRHPGSNVTVSIRPGSVRSWRVPWLRDVLPSTLRQDQRKRCTSFHHVLLEVFQSRSSAFLTYPEHGPKRQREWPCADNNVAQWSPVYHLDRLRPALHSMISSAGSLLRTPPLNFSSEVAREPWHKTAGAPRTARSHERAEWRCVLERFLVM